MEIKSEIKEEPLFSFKNFFRPTSKNVLSWATIVKGLCATGMATSFATSSAFLFYTFMTIGGLAEAFIYFTREKPIDTLIQASADIREEVIDGQA